MPTSRRGRSWPDSASPTTTSCCSPARPMSSQAGRHEPPDRPAELSLKVPIALGGHGHSDRGRMAIAMAHVGGLGICTAISRSRTSAYRSTSSSGPRPDDLNPVTIEARPRPWRTSTRLCGRYRVSAAGRRRERAPARHHHQPGLAATPSPSTIRVRDVMTPMLLITGTASATTRRDRVAAPAEARATPPSTTKVACAGSSQSGTSEVRAVPRVQGR